MAWRIELTPVAKKQLAKLDRQDAKRIIASLRERINPEPRQHGKALAGALREFWRFRVGDYRVLARIEEERLLVLVVRIGHRREIYR